MQLCKQYHSIYRYSLLATPQMILTLNQEKRFNIHQQASDHFCEVCHEENKNFLASELQLERERVLAALRGSANIFFPGARPEVVRMPDVV